MAYYTNTKVDTTDFIAASDLEAIETGFATAEADIAVKDETDTITGQWQFNPHGSGVLTEIDIYIGDAVATPTYGMAKIGSASFGRTNNVTGYNLNGSFIFANNDGAVTGDIDFAFLDSSNLVRFALPKSAAGNATYNPRSMLCAGPAVADSDIVTVGYWQAQGIFHNLSCDTSGSGADLGVQNDLEVEGDIFADSILESTAAAGVTIEGVLIKDSIVALGSSTATTQSAADNSTKVATTAYIDGNFEIADADILKADTADVLTAGYAATPHSAGTKSTGTYTPDEADGNFQYAVNGGAHTLAPPTNNCTLVIQYTNNVSAGAITTSGFTLVDGDTISTTDGDDFFFYVTKCNGFSLLTVKALQ